MNAPREGSSAASGSEARRPDRGARVGRWCSLSPMRPARQWIADPRRPRGAACLRRASPRAAEREGATPGAARSAALAAAGALGLRARLLARTPGAAAGRGRRRAAYLGSERCRACHAEFHALLVDVAPRPHHAAVQSRAGQAAAGPARADHGRLHELSRRHRAGAGGRGGSGRPQALRDHVVIGGKNVYYLLTPLERGRLQVLPVAFDLGAQPLVRHGRQRRAPPARRR